MHYEFEIDEPIEKVIGDWNFLDDRVIKKFSTWREVGQNIFGLRERDVTYDGITDPNKGAFPGILEMGSGGISMAAFDVMNVHVTVGGTPHHVPHNFGYWHINDMDELYLPIPKFPGSSTGHFLTIMQTPRANQGESFAWYCHQCGTLHYECRLKTGAIGINGFWIAEEKAVRAYNADPVNRTCPECGFLNPLGYCWNSIKDTPDERLARAQW
ncbi:cupin domain-containing protein [Burkholderia cepacia]|uniref:hypothetical protein n=1 Tax=Burkholderia cepacia TaxID=292 RepID=UPI002AB6F525|nr:hypothetical protein [Burkholderia cepacia]